MSIMAVSLRDRNLTIQMQYDVDHYEHIEPVREVMIGNEAKAEPEALIQSEEITLT
jgi:hypothetical protein